MFCCQSTNSIYLPPEHLSFSSHVEFASYFSVKLMKFFYVWVWCRKRLTSRNLFFFFWWWCWDNEQHKSISMAMIFILSIPHWEQNKRHFEVSAAGLVGSWWSIQEKWFQRWDTITKRSTDMNGFECTVTFLTCGYIYHTSSTVTSRTHRTNTKDNNLCPKHKE